MAAPRVPSIEAFQQLAARLAILERRMKAVETQPLALQWIKPDQAAEILSCSLPTVSRMCDDNRLVARKGARAVHIKLESVRAYLETQRIDTAGIDEAMARVHIPRKSRKPQA